MLVNFAHVFPLFAVLVIGGRSKNTEREIYPAANHEEDWRRVEGFEFLSSKQRFPVTFISLEATFGQFRTSRAQPGYGSHVRGTNILVPVLRCCVSNTTERFVYLLKYIE